MVRSIAICTFIISISSNIAFSQEDATENIMNQFDLNEFSSAENLEDWEAHAQTAALLCRTLQIIAHEPPIIPAPLDGKRHIPMFAKTNPGGNLGVVISSLNNKKI